MALLQSAFGDDTDLLYDTDFRVLLIANMSAPLGTALVSPLLNSLIVPLNASEASIGLVMAVFTLPGMFLTPLAGVVSDRFGRKPVLLTGLAVFGAAGMAIAAADTFATVIGLRFVQGIGYAGVTPILVASIGDLYVDNTEATAQGLRFTTSGIIQTVFPLVAGALVVVSWRYPFLLYATAIPVVFVVYRWFEEPTARSDDEQNADSSTPDALTDGDGEEPANASEQASLSVRFEQFVRLLLTRRILLATVARATPPFVYFGFLTYNSIIVRTMGGTPTDAGVLVGVASIGYAISASQSGRVNAYFGTRTAPLILTNVVMAGSFVVIALAPSMLAVGVGVAILGIGFGLSLTLYRSLLTGIVSASNRGGVVSVGESTGRAAITIVPVVMGAVLAAAEPVVGFDAAVRVMLLTAGLVPNLLGIACMTVLRYAPGPAT